MTVKLGGIWGRLALAIAAVLTFGSAQAAAQVTDGDVTFGMVGPFSGSARELGRRAKTGLEVAFAAANEAGGIHGRKLKLVTVDDGFEPARTAAAMKELVEVRKVFAVVGNVGTANAAAALPYVNEKGVLFFGALSGASALRQRPPDRYVFNVRASYAQETAATVRHLVEVRRIRPERIAVFMQDDAFGEAGFEGVAKIMRQYGRNPAKVTRVRYKRNSTDVDDAVRVVRKHAKELDAVVMVASYKPATRFIEKLRDAGVKHLVFTNLSDVGANELADELSQLGPGYAEGVIVTNVVPLPTSNATPILKYREQLKRFAPGEKPGVLSLESWIAAQLLIEGLQRAGRELTTDRLIAALEAIRALDIGLGTPLGFGPSEHQASHLVWGTVLDAKGVPQLLALE